jgi:hypothetical protein
MRSWLYGERQIEEVMNLLIRMFFKDDISSAKIT